MPNFLWLQVTEGHYAISLAALCNTLKVVLIKTNETERADSLLPNIGMDASHNQIDQKHVVLARTSKL